MSGMFGSDVSGGGYHPYQVIEKRGDDGDKSGMWASSFMWVKR